MGIIRAILFGVLACNVVLGDDGLSKKELKQLYQDFECCKKDCVVPWSAIESLRTTLTQCQGDFVFNECGSACDTYCGMEPVPCTLQCVQKCTCPPGYIEEAKDSFVCIPNEECDQRLASKLCERNEDCDTNEWCRLTRDRIEKRCTPYANVGDYCGGFTPEYAEERCAPHLSCEDRNDPRIVDDPGICVDLDKACAYSFVHPVTNTQTTRHYNLGESFKAVPPNDCNTCICLETGVACTERVC